MFRISFQKIQTIGLVTTRGLLSARSSHRHMMQTGMAAALVTVCVFGHGPGNAQGATFRVDDAALTVPAILSDQWNAVRHRKTWTRASGEKIDGEPRFIRFLARDYSFTTTEDILRVKTTWFSAGRCVSTDEAVHSLNTAKRRVIEAAFGSLNEMSHRLLKEPGASENRIVIWAHFRSDREVSLPVDTLAAEELGVLSPFADLARQAFESRLFGDAKCKEIENSSEARAAARSGGRRMSPSRAQTRMSSTRSAPRPTGGVVAGAIPQAATIPARTDRQVANSKKSKEKWAILVSQYVAEPGSLVFKLVGQFTRCVTAESEVKAISMVKGAFSSRVTPVGGQRVSYTVSSVGAGSCEQSTDVSGSAVPGNFENPGTGDSSFTDGILTDPGGTGSVQPFPDPLDIGPTSPGRDQNSGGELDDFDFESIPTADGLSEASEPVPEPTQPSPEPTEPVES